jgi:zinc and cadmium transporter
MILTISVLFFSVIGGYLLFNIIGSNELKTKMIVAFSGAFILGLVFLHLAPEVFSGHSHTIGLWVLLGFLLQVILELFSGGVEHGHVHLKNKINYPWSIFISLCIHSFIEAMPLAYPSIHHQHSNPLLFGIALHHLPVTLALVSFMNKGGVKKVYVFISVLIFASIAPAGYILAKSFDLNLISEDFSKIVSAIVIGIFLHLSTTILFETDKGHKFNLVKFTSIILGFGIAYLSVL